MARYRNPQNFRHRAGCNDPLSIAGIPMKANFDEIHESINLEYEKFIIKFFFMNFEVKIAVKMNLRIITKNHAADPEKGFLKKKTLSTRMAAQRPCRQRGSSIEISE